MLLVLCVQWQKRNLPATSLESHSSDGDDSVKQYISVGIQELSVYASLEMWINVIQRDGKNCLQEWVGMGTNLMSG